MSDDRMDGAQGRLRDRLADSLDQDSDAIIESAREAVKAVKAVSRMIECKVCGAKRSYSLEIPDAVAASRAIDILANQAFKRPGVDQPADADREQIIFTRTVIYEGVDPAA